MYSEIIIIIMKLAVVLFQIFIKEIINVSIFFIYLLNKHICIFTPTHICTQKKMVKNVKSKKV